MSARARGVLIALAALAVTAVLAFGVFVPHSQPLTVVPVATPSATVASATSSPIQSADPSASPSPRGSASVTGLLAPGIYHSVKFVPGLSFYIPPSWVQISDQPQSYVLQRLGHGGGVYCPDTGPRWNESCGPHLDKIVVIADPVLASDAGDCEGVALRGASTSVDGMVAALRLDRRFTVGEAHLVSIGGRAGLEFVIQLALDWAETCKWSAPLRGALVLTTAQAPRALVGLRGLDKLNLILLDSVDGTVVISLEPADTRPDPKTSFDEARSVIDTFEFGP